MMAKLNLAFWNVQNLFAVPAANEPTRGPQTAVEFEAKMDRISGVVGDFFDKKGPDLFGIAEVATETVFHDLIDRLPQSFSRPLRIWAPATRTTDCGLGLVGCDDRIARLSLVDVWRPTLAARPRILIVECELRASPRPIWVVVNHWKSRMKTTPVSLGPRDRLEGANWLGTRLALARSMRCVVIVGDFNCEPTERPFQTLQLRGTRHASTAIASKKAASTVYNTAWRYLAEPDPWEHPRPSGYRASRPRTTFGTSSKVFDHLLVSKDALQGLPLALDERTITYHADARTYRYNANGMIEPLKWAGPVNGPFHGASDHLPLLATFEVR